MRILIRKNEKDGESKVIFEKGGNLAKVGDRRVIFDCGLEGEIRGFYVEKFEKRGTFLSEEDLNSREIDRRRFCSWMGEKGKDFLKVSMLNDLSERGLTFCQTQWVSGEKKMSVQKLENSQGRENWVSKAIVKKTRGHRMNLEEKFAVLETGDFLKWFWVKDFLGKK